MKPSDIKKATALLAEMTTLRSNRSNGYKIAICRPTEGRGFYCDPILHLNKEEFAEFIVPIFDRRIQEVADQLRELGVEEEEAEHEGGGMTGLADFGGFETKQEYEKCIRSSIERMGWRLLPGTTPDLYDIEHPNDGFSHQKDVTLDYADAWVTGYHECQSKDLGAQFLRQILDEASHATQQ